MLKKENYSITESAKEKVVDYIKQNSKNNNFSNGRFIRNMFEKLKIEQSTRVLQEDSDKSLITIDDVNKVIEADYIVKEERVIGFK